MEIGGVVAHWGHNCRCLEVAVCDSRHRHVDVWVVVIWSHVAAGGRSHDHRGHLYLVRAHCALCL